MSYTFCLQAIEDVSEQGKDVLAHVETAAKLENIIAMIGFEKIYATTLHRCENLAEVEAALKKAIQSSQQSFESSFSIATVNLEPWLKNALSSPTAPDPSVEDLAAFKKLMNQVTSVSVCWQADTSVPQTLEMLRDWHDKLQCFAEDHSRELRKGVDERLSKLSLLTSAGNNQCKVPWSRNVRWLCHVVFSKTK